MNQNQRLLLRNPFDAKTRSLECTIGICAYNEAKNIGRLLESLIADQSLTCNSEILVVSSGSTDVTTEIVSKFSEKDRRVELIVQGERLGKASAINEILKRASHEIIFLIPADVLPAPSSLIRLASEFSNPKVGVVCGSPLPVNSERNFSGYLANLMWRLHNRTLKLLGDSDINTHASGELMAVRGGIIDHIPMNTVNDDAYLAVEISKGYRVKYCESAKVYLKAPSNIADYVRQRRRVMFGHHSVRRTTGSYPRTLGAMPYYDLRRLLKVIRDEISYRASDIPKLGLAIALEIVSNVLAWIDVILKRKYISWSAVTSTKDLSARSKFNIAPLLDLHNVKEINMQVNPQ